jgi:hypothetical protein
MANRNEWIKRAAARLSSIEAGETASVQCIESLEAFLITCSTFEIRRIVFGTKSIDTMALNDYINSLFLNANLPLPIKDKSALREVV